MLETPEALLGTFAVLQALAGFVPVPFLDGIVARQIARRMVETVARTHGIRLSDEEIKLFADEPDEGILAFLKRAAKSLLLFPIRLLFRAIFLVLDAKQVTELVGRAYARGVALDIAFGEGLYLAHGAAKVASAVEASLATVDTRPLKRGTDAAWAKLKLRGPEFFGRLLGAFKARREDDAAAQATPLGEAFAEGVSGERTTLRASLRASLAKSLGAPDVTASTGPTGL